MVLLQTCVLVGKFFWSTKLIELQFVVQYGLHLLTFDLLTIYFTLSSYLQTKVIRRHNKVKSWFDDQ